MEQTLGKRIMENRKKLGLTQDQLAEKLGVTAQAVSKWENDQSCPDITMLPKLAEIFGTTTDALLGWQAQPVHQAEVVSDDEDEEEENEGIHIQNGNWEFKWDSGRKDAVLFAVFVLLVGGLMLVAKLLRWDVSFWEILWPSALLMYGLRRVFSRFSFFGIGCTLFGGYFLLENLGITQLNLAGELIFPILIVIFGLSLLADALHKPKKPRFHIVRNGKSVGSGDKNTKSTFTTDAHSFDCSLSFGENTHYIELPLLQHGDISCSFGELTVDLTGCEEVFQNCRIDVNCSFGELTLRVPRRFRVDPDSSTAFASLDIDGHPDPEPKGVIRLDANINFGEITVKYI
jgi:transcriptional regulator with XRE-family HTH domain